MRLRRPVAAACDRGRTDLQCSALRLLRQLREAALRGQARRRPAHATLRLAEQIPDHEVGDARNERHRDDANQPPEAAVRVLLGRIARLRHQPPCGTFPCCHGLFPLLDFVKTDW